MRKENMIGLDDAASVAHNEFTIKSVVMAAAKLAKGQCDEERPGSIPLVGN
jgi:hypothetical protein